MWPCSPRSRCLPEALAWPGTQPWERLHLLQGHCNKGQGSGCWTGGWWSQADRGSVLLGHARWARCLPDPSHLCSTARMDGDAATLPFLVPTCVLGPSPPK